MKREQRSISTKGQRTHLMPSQAGTDAIFTLQVALSRLMDAFLCCGRCGNESKTKKASAFDLFTNQPELHEF